MKTRFSTSYLYKTYKKSLMRIGKGMSKRKTDI